MVDSVLFMVMSSQKSLVAVGEASAQESASPCGARGLRARERVAHVGSPSFESVATVRTGGAKTADPLVGENADEAGGGEQSRNLCDQHVRPPFGNQVLRHSGATITVLVNALRAQPMTRPG